MKLSINTTLMRNSKDIDANEIDSTFENIDDLSKKELVTLIRNSDRFIFAPQVKKNLRSSNNFRCSGFLAVYIDNGSRLDEMIEQDYIKSFASFVYTTPDHTEEDHKYRVVFELEEDITDEGMMKHASSGISKKLGADPIFLDASRMHFGSKGCKIYDINKTLPKREVEKLLVHGKESYRPLHLSLIHI